MLAFTFCERHEAGVCRDEVRYGYVAKGDEAVRTKIKIHYEFHGQ